MGLAAAVIAKAMAKREQIAETILLQEISGGWASIRYVYGAVDLSLEMRLKS
jgi:hypothetical protein